ncbi:MAG TPA: helix-turn-helix transcriptional regulator [Bacillota bacterium]|nr:helix-turn-helix transcriptional regulator [Bacillota bacterium]
MTVSYNRLWKLLIDKNMNKKDLREKASLGTATVSRLVKGENVTTDVLLKICEALDCGINDILEVIPGSDSGARTQKQNGENI